jgi:pyruvate kinase
MKDSENSILCDQQEMMASLLHDLKIIREEMLALDSVYQHVLKDLTADRKASARNLLHYVALRRRDLRELQERLAICGLSSLGRCESYVLANLETVISLLHKVTDQSAVEQISPQYPVEFRKGRQLLEMNAEELLGKKRVDAGLTIMVTMPFEATDNYELIKNLLQVGMGVMRINCAHDDVSAWKVMIDHLRKAEAETGFRCKVAMDLGGPKIRTCELVPGPQVMHWQPERDVLGKLIAPVHIWLAFPEANGITPVGTDVIIRLSDQWWKGVNAGDEVCFVDALGRERELQIISRSEHGLSAEARQSAYVTPETKVSLLARDSKVSDDETASGFGHIPHVVNYILLRQGDLLRVTRPEFPGRNAQYDEHDQLVEPACIGCSLPEVFDDVKVGHRILFDDGKIAGIVREVAQDQLLVEITRARKEGQKLRADKGINLPDTNLQLPALTKQDIEDLRFVSQYADIVNYSFVRRVEDIQLLRKELELLGKPELGIILKVENQQAFENLPLLLLEISNSAQAGVMIARGDLAVELGWERLVEVQEEILWLCEAAHRPVIWATQVLDGLAKKGIPTRAEISDAGMAARAECVMLNKGPNILEAVRLLQDIIRRMQRHQTKKRSLFRKLSIADGLSS